MFLHQESFDSLRLIAAHVEFRTHVQRLICWLPLTDDTYDDKSNYKFKVSALATSDACQVPDRTASNARWHERSGVAHRSREGDPKVISSFSSKLIL